MDGFADIVIYPEELTRLVRRGGDGFYAAVQEQRAMGLTHEEAFSKIAKISMYFFSTCMYSNFKSYQKSRSYWRKKESDLEKVFNKGGKTFTPNELAD